MNGDLYRISRKHFFHLRPVTNLQVRFLDEWIDPNKCVCVLFVFISPQTEFCSIPCRKNRTQGNIAGKVIGLTNKETHTDGPKQKPFESDQGDNK